MEEWAAAIDWGDLSEFFLQLLGILIAAVVVVWQVNRQHRSNLELQREDLRNKQRIQLFDALIEKIRTAEDTLGRVAGWGSMLPTILRLNLEHDLVQIDYRISELQDLQNKADACLIEVIAAIEHREIIHPAFVVFRYAIARQSEYCREAFTELSAAVRPILPVDPPAGVVVAQPRRVREHDRNDIEIVREAQDEVKNAYWTLSSFLGDLSCEAQNSLLGGLFTERVSERRPLDPDVLVLGTSRESLERIEERLRMADVLHPDALPSRVLYGPKRTRRWGFFGVT